ncbi:hypothetical protein B0T20DRAFT_86157 [Sordaria brevicollis]|uniref:Uncharacterized protein n=1 Tax=Sordaria brevicollis TaxID=83679 RepID=A0AAE0NW71_SORBR|nr:hypothetical protein B0T20DRAFT_86157 [Sordaria brevicollis]
MALWRAWLLPFSVSAISLPSVISRVNTLLITRPADSKGNSVCDSLAFLSYNQTIYTCLVPLPVAIFFWPFLQLINTTDIDCIRRVQSLSVSTLEHDSSPPGKQTTTLLFSIIQLSNSCQFYLLTSCRFPYP